MCMYVYLHKSMCMHMQVSSEVRGQEISGIVVESSYELPVVGAKNWSQAGPPLLSPQ